LPPRSLAGEGWGEGNGHGEFHYQGLNCHARQVRIDRMAKGNAGDVKPVGEGVSEMRIHVGAGYRVYFTRVGTTIVLLLCGGDKSAQNRDIERALEMARILKE
jgi:putative addiction module killer protein